MTVDMCISMYFYVRTYVRTVFVYAKIYDYLHVHICTYVRPHR